MKLEPYALPDAKSRVTQPPSHRMRLANLPTPLEPWAFSTTPPGTSLWLIRDDMTGAALSGNKVRKLEFLLADAMARECDTILTCGGIQSNHARATAVAAAQLGLTSHLFLRVTDPTEDPGRDGNLLLDHLVDATIHLITPDQYQQRNERLQAESDKLRALGKRPYIIPEGGSNALGCWGYIEALREWRDHHDLRKLGITDIVVALGSGGTAAGLAAGLSLLNLTPRLHAVNVCDDADYFHHRIQELFHDLGLAMDSKAEIDIIDGYVGLGYAQSRNVELALLHDVARETGILLDPVYTGKTFFALQQELYSNPNRFQGKKILFIHTGGIFGLYPVKERLPFSS